MSGQSEVSNTGSILNNVANSSMEFAYAIHPCRLHIRRAVDSWTFDIIIVCIVVLNAVCSGVEQHYRVAEGRAPLVLVVLEASFQIIYALELFSRLTAHGWACLHDPWVKFDATLVFLSATSELLLPLLLNNTSPGALVGLAKTARLCRCIRLLKVLHQFRELWLLLEGFVNSLRMICYTFLLLAVVLYICGMVGVEVITLRQADGVTWTRPENEMIIDIFFANLADTMLTLIQFICMDSIGAIYRPLMQEDWLSGVYFTSVIVVLAIVLMNIITAVTVNAALEQAKRNRAAAVVHAEQERKKIMKDLRRMFQRLDKDGSGILQLDELLQAPQKELRMLEDFMEGHSFEEVFHALDMDGSGELDALEFTEGLYEVVTSKVPIEIKRIEKRADALYRNSVNLLNMQSATVEVLTVIASAFAGNVAPRAEGFMNGASPQHALSPQPTINRLSVESAIYTQATQELMDVFEVKAGDTRHVEPKERASVAACDDVVPPWAKTLLQEVRTLSENVASQTGFHATTIEHLERAVHFANDARRDVKPTRGGRASTLVAGQDKLLGAEKAPTPDAPCTTSRPSTAVSTPNTKATRPVQCDIAHPDSGKGHADPACAAEPKRLAADGAKREEAKQVAAEADKAAPAEDARRVPAEESKRVKTSSRPAPVPSIMI